MEQAANKEVSYVDFLDELLAAEAGAKTHKHHLDAGRDWVDARCDGALRVAKEPWKISSSFKLQPSIDLMRIRELGTSGYMQGGDNVLFLGPRRGGKSHLGVGAGNESPRAGRVHSVRYRHRAHHLAQRGLDGRQTAGTNHDPHSARLLIIDEIARICRLTVRAPNRSSSWCHDTTNAVRSRHQQSESRAW